MGKGEVYDGKRVRVKDGKRGELRVGKGGLLWWVTVKGEGYGWEKEVYGGKREG